MTNLNSAHLGGTRPNDHHSPVLGGFLRSPGGQRCCAMLGDERAQGLLLQVHKVCTATMPVLNRSTKHLSRDLCGAAFWASLPLRMQICAGICISFMARAEHLPLRLHRTRRGRGSKKYLLR